MLSFHPLAHFIKVLLLGISLASGCLMICGQKTHTTEFYFSLQPMYSHPFGLIPSADDSYSVWKQTQTLEDKRNIDPGFYIDFLLTEKLALGTGFRISNRGFRRNFKIGSDIVYGSEGIHDSIFRNDYLGSQSWTDTYFSVPLQLGYRLFRTRNNTFTVRLGSSIDLLWRVRDHREYWSVSNSNYIYKSEELYLAFPLSLGIRYSFAFSDEMIIFWEPQFNLVLKEREEEMGMRYRYLTYGLNVGFYLKI
jgi:hypothetical protein